MPERPSVFIDTGAWIALALKQDPLHERALEHWEKLLGAGARLHTSIPVVLETFTFLDRNASRDVALTWKEKIYIRKDLEIVECGLPDLRRSWAYFARRDLHKLSAVDATSFAIMTRKKIKVAFAYDHHFAMVGFHMAG